MTNTVIKLTKDYTKIDSISEAKCLYSLTKEVEEYVGACIRVIEFGGGTEKDIYFTGDGKLDTVELLAHTGSDDGEIVTWYDQKEFSDAVSSSTQRPRIVNGGVLETENGEPCLVFDNVNDVLLANTPYSVSESVVSTLSVLTVTTSGETDIIIGTSAVNKGINIGHQSTDNFRIVTYRTANTVCLSANTYTAETVVLGGMVDRTNIELYEDGVLAKTVSDTNTDFTASTSMSIGAHGSAANPSAVKFQFHAVFLTNESTNMAEYYTQLSTRFDSSLTNDDNSIYFSDTPVLLSNDYYANGRIVGDINFSENIKVFAWSSRPQGGFGNIDLVNIDSEWNEIVETDYIKIDIYNYDGTTLTEFGTGRIDNIGYVEKGRIRITMKSEIDKLRVELPSGRFDSTYPDLENEKKLFVLGKCNLNEPRLLDVATNKYFIADNLESSTKVYDNGISVGYTNTSEGYTLTANPVGRILSIDRGFDDGAGGYESHISEHIPRLLKNIDIEYQTSDLTSIYAAMETSWAGKDEDVLTAINELLDGLVSYMYADSSGKLRFGKLALPTSPTSYLYEREIIGDIKAFKDSAENLSGRLLNVRNFNPYQTSELAFATTATDKVNLVKDYKATSLLDGLHPFYLKANVDIKSLSKGGLTDGATILADIIALWSSIRYFYTLSSVNDYDLNEVVNVTHTEKGLESGKDLLCISKSKSTLTEKINYTFWG